MNDAFPKLSLQWDSLRRIVALEENNRAGRGGVKFSHTCIIMRFSFMEMVVSHADIVVSRLV